MREKAWIKEDKWGRNPQSDRSLCRTRSNLSEYWIAEIGNTQESTLTYVQWLQCPFRPSTLWNLGAMQGSHIKFYYSNMHDDMYMSHDTPVTFYDNGSASWSKRPQNCIRLNDIKEKWHWIIWIDSSWNFCDSGTLIHFIASTSHVIWSSYKMLPSLIKNNPRSRTEPFVQIE